MEIERMNMTHTEIENARLTRLIDRLENDTGTVLLRQGEPIAAILPYGAPWPSQSVSRAVRDRSPRPPLINGSTSSLKGWM